MNDRDKRLDENATISIATFRRMFYPDVDDATFEIVLSNLKALKPSISRAEYLAQIRAAKDDETFEDIWKSPATARFAIIDWRFTNSDPKTPLIVASITRGSKSKYKGERGSSEQQMLVRLGRLFQKTGATCVRETIELIKATSKTKEEEKEERLAAIEHERVLFIEAAVDPDFTQWDEKSAIPRSRLARRIAAFYKVNAHTGAAWDSAWRKVDTVLKNANLPS